MVSVWKHKTLDKHLIVFNLPNAGKVVDLTVYGFFRKKSFTISLTPQVEIETQSFQTSVSSFSRMPTIKDAEIQENLPVLKIPTIAIKKQTAIQNIPVIAFNATPFNQNELI